MPWTPEEASQYLTSNPRLLQQFYASNPNFRNAVTDADVIGFVTQAVGANPPGGRAGSPSFNAQQYAQSRPDLVNNWNAVKAGNASFLPPEVVAYINSLPSLDAYLQADFQGYPGGVGVVSGTSGVTTTTTTPPADTTTLPTYVDPTTAFHTEFGTPEWLNGPPPSGPPAGPPSGPPGGGTIVETGLGTFRDLGSEGANTLQAQALLAPQMLDLYRTFSPLYVQQDLTNLRNTLYGSVDAGQFLAAHPEFQQGFDEAQARGENPQAWLDQVVGTSTYIDQATVPRGGGMFGINQALTQSANEQTVRSNTGLRAGNMADAAMFGPQSLGLLKALNPGQYQSLAQANQAATTGFGPNQYQNQLGTQFGAGPQFQSVNAQQISPFAPVTTNRDPLLGIANYDAATSGFSPLGMDLTSMARQQLALGREVDPDALRRATQAEREAWSARGLAFSPGAVADEILARDELANRRLQERQAFAQNVNQLEQGQLGQNRQYTLGVLGANQGYGGQNLQAQGMNLGAGLDVARLNQGANLQGQLANQGTGLQAQQQNQALGLELAGMEYGRQQQNFGNLFANTQLQSQNAFNPFALTGATAQNAGSNAGMFNAGSGITSGGTGNAGVQSMFDPFNPYSSDLYNTNYNALTAARIGAANSSSGKTAGWLGALGTIGGSLIGAPWLGAVLGGVAGASKKGGLGNFGT